MTKTQKRDGRLKAFGKNLQDLRRHRGLTLSTLARISGVPKSTLSHLESGSANPTLSTLMNLSGALRVTLEELLSQPAIPMKKTAASEMPLFREQQGSGKLFRVIPDPFPEIDLFILDLIGSTPFAGTTQPKGSGRLIVAYTGGVRVRVGGETVDLEEGASLIFPGNEPHSYEAIDRKARALVIKFNGFHTA
jgi:transcriptional regulator with XRE-family HTH domain